jgi:hypothetical protein
VRRLADGGHLTDAMAPVEEDLDRTAVRLRLALDEIA